MFDTLYDCTLFQHIGCAYAIAVGNVVTCNMSDCKLKTVTAFLAVLKKLQPDFENLPRHKPRHIVRSSGLAKEEMMQLPTWMSHVNHTNPMRVLKGVASFLHIVLDICLRMMPFRMLHLLTLTYFFK